MSTNRLAANRLAEVRRRHANAEVGGGEFDGACQVGDVVAGVTAVKGRDAAVKAMTFLLKGLRIPK